MSQTLTRVTRFLVLGTLGAAPVSAQLPAAKELNNRYITAVGGADVIKKHKAMHAIGKFEVPAQGMTGTLETWVDDGKVLSVIEIPGIGSIRSGYDGQVAWQIHPALGANLLTGKQFDQLKQQADPHSTLTPEKYIKTSETTEKTTFDGKEAYKVKIVLHNGEEYFEIYDAKNGLNIGTIRNTETPMGPIETTSTISEYQKFDGQLMTTKVKQAAMGIEQVLTITTVEFTAPPAGTFELPKEIKALAGK